MADKKISALTSASTPLAGTEVLPIVQSGATVKVAVSDLTAGRAVNASSLTTTGNVGVGAAASSWDSAFGGIAQVSTPGSGGGALGGSSADNFRMFSNTYYNGGYKRIAAGYAAQYEQASGTHVWYTAGTSTANSAISFTQAWSIDTNNNLIPAVAAKGVNFTANTPAAGMTSQLLNWYEEGTWTPTVTAGSGTITTVTGASGKYVRIGQTVYVNCTFQITTNGTGASYLLVSGLPFTVSTASPSAGYNSSDAVTLSGTFGASSSTFNLFKYDGTYPGASGKTYYASGVYLV